MSYRLTFRLAAILAILKIFGSSNYQSVSEVKISSFTKFKYIPLKTVELLWFLSFWLVAVLHLF